MRSPRQGRRQQGRQRRQRNRVPARFRRELKKMNLLVLRKVGPHGREVTARIEISEDFKDFLRRNYGICGRWEPSAGAEHQRFMQEASIENTRFFQELDICYRIAVVQFKVNSTSSLTYLNSRRKLSSIDVCISWLAIRFSCEQTQPEE